MIKHATFGFLCVYMALLGTFAGIGLRSIEGKIQSAQIQAISSVYVGLPIVALSMVDI